VYTKGSYQRAGSLFENGVARIRLKLSIEGFFSREKTVRRVRDFTARARYPSSLISYVELSVMWRSADSSKLAEDRPFQNAT